MTRDMRRLLQELDLPGGCPDVSPKAITHRVNAALNADPGERKLYMKQKIRFAAVLVAAVIALTGTALAVSPGLREMIAQALGTFAPYAQVVEGATVTDQGLKVTVEAVLSDAETTTAYVSVTDLKGDRLDEHTRYNDRGNCVSYDSESRTALFAVPVRPKDFNEDGSIRLEFRHFQPGYLEQYDLSFPRELLTDRTAATQTLKAREITDGLREGQTEALVLVPGQTPMALIGTDLIAVSSSGFDQRGVFHILYEFLDGITPDNDPGFGTSFDDRDRPDGYHTDAIGFDGGRYMDVAYSSYRDKYSDYPALVTRENVSHLILDNGYCWLNTKPRIEGEWNLIFPVETLPRRIVTIGQPIGSLMVKSISFTSISATAEVEQIPDVRPRYSIPGLPLTLYLKDGTVVPVKDKYGWIFDQAIDPDEVTALAIGMWYIPLEGDAALPGYWLEKLPE